MKSNEYCFMECLSPDNGFKALITHDDDDPLRSWTLGEKFDTGPRTPIQVTARMRKNSMLVEMWKAPLPIMSSRLRAVFDKLAVRNIDFYDLCITEQPGGKKHNDYYAFNVIGSVQAVDMERSSYTAHPHFEKTGMDFSSVVLAQGRTYDHLIFRLKEATNALVVHRAVKEAVLTAGIDTLTFMEPEDWAG